LIAWSGPCDRASLADVADVKAAARTEEADRWPLEFRL
jgi:hypothetical protein